MKQRGLLVNASGNLRPDAPPDATSDMLSRCSQTSGMGTNPYSVHVQVHACTLLLQEPKYYRLGAGREARPVMSLSKVLSL